MYSEVRASNLVKIDLKGQVIGHSDWPVNPAVILRNHGLLAWGDTLARTFAILWLLNRACEIQLASTSMGPVIEIPEDIQKNCTRDSRQFHAKFGAGQDVFDALTRAIDRIDPSYKS